MHRTVLQPVTHTLYTIVSSIVLNIIETDFRTNVRFRILVRHGRLSEKLISVVGQMSVSDKCPRIFLSIPRENGHDSVQEYSCPPPPPPATIYDSYYVIYLIN